MKGQLYSVMGPIISGMPSVEPLPAASAVVHDHVLDNGLRVLIQEVHTAPLASVWCWYRVGSKNETPGLTGVSHWVEHMNFKGTTNIPRDKVKGIIEKYGGYWNGYTWIDQTTYTETATRDALDHMLFIESERMTSCLYDPSDFESERTVIIAELQGGENDPDTLLDQELTATAFRAHPYRHPTIGWLSDLQRMTRDELYGYYTRFYVPNNATLVIVGDVDSGETMRSVERQFGRIPARDVHRPPHTREPQQLGERRVKVSREGTTAYLKVGFHAPAATEADFFPLLVLDAVLTGAKGVNLWASFRTPAPQRSARLYQRLVNRGLASAVNGGLIPTDEPFLYTISATAMEGVGPRDPGRRPCWRVGARSGGRRDGRRASEGQEPAARPSGVRERQHRQHRPPARLLPDARRLAPLSFDSRAARGGHPGRGCQRGGQPADAGEQDGRLVRAAAAGGPTGFWRWSGSRGGVPMTVGAGSLPRRGLAPVRQVLPNGVVVITKQSRVTPAVTLSATVRAGTIFDPATAGGLAHFVSRTIDRGTLTRDADTIAEELDVRGVSLTVSVNRHMISLICTCLVEDFEPVVALLADIVGRPAFPAGEVETRRGEIVTLIRQDEDNPATVAAEGLMALLYGAQHPYGTRPRGTVDSVQRIDRRALGAFHAARFVPGALTLALVGDIEPERALDTAAAAFEWPPHADFASGPALPDPPALTLPSRRPQAPGARDPDDEQGAGGHHLRLHVHHARRSGISRLHADEQHPWAVLARRTARRQHP